MDLLQEIDWQLVAPLLVIQLILMIVALVDWIKADDFNGPKWLWFFIIIFLSIPGPVIYFIFGRRR
ncbi:PLD nuclease N-terminal domain-containing protein [Virgibacillus sp. YIM 98842]|jgi:phosphoglycerol transferase MdoB-like AlkP superfamily enzyme|uniref:PLD nuclease N-terminal domain-containing protein n=1 Tax=Virgibacillus sp. YIM 98842 TaxID=2663533 RepID=UPI0013DB1B01|nr:PLD nuclease N-terminal domain-containing protein [Virgibacillus sp. YIM 98842]